MWTLRGSSNQLLIATLVELFNFLFFFRKKKKINNLDINTTFSYNYLNKIPKKLSLKRGDMGTKLDASSKKVQFLSTN